MTHINIYNFLISTLMLTKLPISLIKNSLPFKQLLINVNFAYHDNVIDHYENPRNVGSLDKNRKNVGTGLVGAPACGDVMKLQI